MICIEERVLVRWSIIGEERATRVTFIGIRCGAGRSGDDVVVGDTVQKGVSMGMVTRRSIGLWLMTTERTMMCHHCVRNFEKR